MRILGLDPGSLHTGYSIVDRRGSALRAVEHGRISCPRGAPLPARLDYLSRQLDDILGRFQPAAAALESLYRGKNVRSLIVLAQARGALLARLAATEIEIVEYTPAEVKAAVTGNGRADKQQVARMVRLILGLGEAPMAADTSDALAVAICFAQRRRMDRFQAGKGGLNR